MKVSDHIILVVQLFEGFEPVAKHLSGDPTNIITGGYGTIIHPDGRAVKPGDVFTREYALFCLKDEMDKKCVKLNKLIDIYGWQFNQDQFDALASFIYNVGEGKLDAGTTMGDALRARDILKIANAFLVYTKGTKYFLGIPRKVDLPGLVKRRKAERDLFLSRLG